MRIALAGNPNSGKTTLFNAVTGKIERVGNWPGVTVTKKEGDVKKSLNNSGRNIRVVDLPGAYSLASFTSEESITGSFIRNENPDVIINIIDTTNLSRSLFLTTQLLELGIPVVIALNKDDLLSKKGMFVDAAVLAEKLGCPVVETSSTKGKGLEELIEQVNAVGGKGQKAPYESVGLIGTDKAAVEAIDRQRFAFIGKIVKEVEVRKAASYKQNGQDIADRIIAHKILGFPIFLAVIYLVFSLTQNHLGPFLAGYFVNWIDSFYLFVEGLLADNVSPLLRSLLLDGIIGGVSAIVGFLPLIMVMFFLLALLEDCGYMARVAVIMDRYLKKVGLSGKSIIPIVLGVGCAIPGIMATRTIRDDRQRRTTAMLAPLMPCGAKLPLISLFAGVFFKGAAWIGTAMYFVAVVIIILGAHLLHIITQGGNSKAYFIMELPEYRLPSLKRAFVSMLSRGKDFIVKAATIILMCNVIIHIMQSFTWDFYFVEEGMESTSILAGVASPFAFLLLPLGFGVWQFAAATITGFIAKENVVATLAVVYGITNFIETGNFVLVSGGKDVAAIMGLTPVAALAYLMFNLFTLPCIAAVSTMNAEMESKKWFWGSIAFQFCTGYTIAYFVYQIGTLVTTGSFGTGVIPGLLAILLMLGVVVFLTRNSHKNN